MGTGCEGWVLGVRDGHWVLGMVTVKENVVWEAY
jgi:hypothetical protein